MHTGMLLWLVWQTVSVTRMKHMHVAFRGRAEALLGYLISGDYGSARAVSEDVVKYAEKLLHDKTSDPGQAAIGAYYLLRAGHRAASVSPEKPAMLQCTCS